MSMSSTCGGGKGRGRGRRGAVPVHTHWHGGTTHLALPPTHPPTLRCASSAAGMPRAFSVWPESGRCTDSMSCPGSGGGRQVCPGRGGGRQLPPLARLGLAPEAVPHHAELRRVEVAVDKDGAAVREGVPGLLDEEDGVGGEHWGPRGGGTGLLQVPCPLVTTTTARFTKGRLNPASNPNTQPSQPHLLLLPSLTHLLQQRRGTST